jgi:acylphosphatase
MTDSPQRLHAIVRGVVQGVNFRYYTQQRAQRLGLQGWARNVADGSVEVVAEGPRAALDELLTFLQRGPRSAQVDEVSANWAPASGQFRQFEIEW